MASAASNISIGRNPSTDPPRYQSMEVRCEQRTQRNAVVQGLSNSWSVAGNSVRRFFGVHDDTLVGWRRTGTHPPSDHLYYAPLTDRAWGTEGKDGSKGRSDRRRQLKGELWRMCKPLKDEIVGSFPTYWPIFTLLTSIIEIALTIAVMKTSGFAPVQFVMKVETTDIVGFDGLNASTTRIVAPNPFVGPSKEAMVHVGAKYPLCMRASPKQPLSGAGDDADLICCQARNSEQCGMLPENVCLYYYGGVVVGGANDCSTEMQSARCKGGVVLHPCCVGLEGRCVLTTEDNCTFHGGYWHSDKVLCSQLGSECLRDVCRLKWINRTIGQIPDQGIRFISAIFLYNGILEFVMVFFPKLYTSWKIERRIGWLRLTIIYFFSGVGGLLLSSIFDPEPAVGNSGAMYGLLGVMLVELLQGWRWIKKPCIELLKLSGFLVLLLGAGTLPYVDNFCHIGGFTFGVLMSFIFVPYISIGEWDKARKLCLIITLTPVSLILLIIGIVVFYNFTALDMCSWCGYLNCIPYTSTFCDI